MLVMSETMDTFHEPMFWLNAAAPENMPFMVVTLAVSHEPMGWLNPDAPLNIALMSVIRVVTMLLNRTGVEYPGGLNAVVEMLLA
jgi:hypothetical protein